MNSHTEPDPQACFPEPALEEYALGRPAADQERHITAHLAACAACAARVQELRAEAASIREALSAAGNLDGGACVTDETLALYLDRGLAEEDRAATENHLSRCRRCQQRLVGLYREVGEVAKVEDPLGLLDSAPTAPPEPIPLEPGRLRPHEAAPARSQTAAQGSTRIGWAWFAAGAVAAGIAAWLGGPLALPFQFAALAAVGAGLAEALVARLARGHTARGAAAGDAEGPGWFSVYGYLSVISFALSLVWMTGSGWCVTGSGVFYLLWLFGRTGQRLSRIAHYQAAAREDEERSAREEGERRKQRYPSR